MRNPIDARAIFFAVIAVRKTFKEWISSHIEPTVKRALQSVYFDNSLDHQASTFLCGTARSGTTWLKDLINYRNEYRFLSEPFNRERVKICRHFGVRQYMRPTDDDPVYLDPARAIFDGKVRDAWIDKNNHQIFARQRLVKDVRSNLMLKWIVKHFPGMPIVLLVRHPCAVAISKVKLGWTIDLEEAFLSQDALVTDYLSPYVGEIAGAKSEFEKQVVAWCIETLVPLAQLNKDDVHLVFYENLCTYPEAELRSLFAFLNRPFDTSVLTRVRKPSGMSRRVGDKSSILSGASLIDAWRQAVTADEIETSRRIVDRFGLDELYGADSVPKIQKTDSRIKTA